MHKKQHTLWLLAALAAPLAHYAGSGWLTAALASAAVLPLSLLPKEWERQPKALALLQILWLGTVAGIMLPNSAAYWPSDNALVVPLTILALAALTGPDAAPRIGALLALCLTLLAVPPAVSGVARMELQWLRPNLGRWPWALTLVLLLPNLPAAKEGGGSTAVPAGILAVLLSLLVQGTISPQVAASVPDRFYQTARTLGHMEPVIASGITLAWYALTGYLLQSAKKMARSGGIGEGKATVLLVGTATWFVIFRVQLYAPFLTVLSGFLWVLSPFLTKIKKVKKS